MLMQYGQAPPSSSGELFPRSTGELHKHQYTLKSVIKDTERVLGAVNLVDKVGVKD